MNKTNRCEHEVGTMRNDPGSPAQTQIQIPRPDSPHRWHLAHKSASGSGISTARRYLIQGAAAQPEDTQTDAGQSCSSWALWQFGLFCYRNIEITFALFNPVYSGNQFDSGLPVCGNAHPASQSDGVVRVSAFIAAKGGTGFRVHLAPHLASQPDEGTTTVSGFWILPGILRVCKDRPFIWT